MLGNTHPYILLYASIAVSAVILVCVYLLSKNNVKAGLYSFFARNIFTVGLIMLVLSVLFQTVYQINHYFKDDLKLLRVPLTTKKTGIFKTPYEFAVNAKKTVTGSRSAELITDMNINRGGGATAYHSLAYFLYPIDIKVRPAYEPVDTCIMFYKKNAVKYVPEGFYPVYRSGDMGVVAIRKEKPCRF